MDIVQSALEISFTTVFQPADVQLERVNPEVNVLVNVKMTNYSTPKVTATHADQIKLFQEESVFVL
jgi:hypothetical protein